MGEYLIEPLAQQIMIIISISLIILIGGIIYLANSLKLRKVELNEKVRQIHDAKKKVKQTYSELKTSNERLEETVEKFQDILSIAGSLGVCDIEEQDFLDLFLQKTLAIINEADYGTIAMIEKDEWRFVSAVGYDIEKLKTLRLKTETVYLKKNTKIVDGLYDRYEKDFDSQTAKILKDAVKPFKQSLIAPLYIEGEFVGNLSLDIAQKSQHQFSEGTKSIVNSISKIAASYLELKKSARNKQVFQKNVILSLVKALEYYDSYTSGHSERVAKYSTMLSEKMGLPREITTRIYWASLVHDVGKIFVPRTILNKVSFLTLEEFDEIKKHSEKGQEILMETDDLKEIAKIVRYHHERWDGSGYPDGLKTVQIPLESRIIALGDSFDAMTTNRPYRASLSYEQAVCDIKKGSGTLYQSELVEAFICDDLKKLLESE